MNHTDISLRMATAADAEAIAAFSRKAFYDTFASANTAENMELFMNSEFTMEKLKAQVGAAGNYFILAFVKDTLAGYARVVESECPAELTGKNTIELARLYNDQAFIGMGIGRALMENCVALARQLNKEVLWLGVWEHNERAIAFYRKWGFEPFGSHVFQVGNDPQTDWLMKKEL
jgi:ribosomal protein S18 acetylase RimI-like enzyme